MKGPPFLTVAYGVPSRGLREDIELSEGATLADIVAIAALRLGAAIEGLRVTLVSPGGVSAPARRFWAHVRPTSGTRVLVRAVPGEDVLRPILSVVVAIGASYLAPIVFPGLAAAGGLGIKLATAGLAVGGQLLVASLIPPSVPSVDGQVERRFRIDGWRNEARPGAPVPLPCGRHRYAPPFAAQPFSEIVGDDQFVRALFTFGYGPVRVTDLRIGNTPIGEFEDVDFELREGRDGDAPTDLYPEQVLEQAEGVELAGPASPTRRFAASNASRFSVLLGFETGLFRVNSKGERRSRSVSVRIRARKDGLGDWEDIATLNIAAAKQEPFFRQHTWEPSERGRWEIEVSRLNEPSDDAQISDRVVLSAIQTYRAEAPVNVTRPISRLAVRIRASRQLNGALDTVNGIVEAEALDFDGAAWTQGFSRNPAATFLRALTGVHNPYPVATSEIDLDLIARWHAYCALKGLRYDRVIDQPMSLWELLREICGAGRATPRHDGLRWGVVVDWNEEIVIDHVNPRNSHDFSWSRAYLRKPDGVRVRFLDETNEFEEAERVIPWPGHVGDVDVTEAWELPGKTDPDEIWRETRRRMYETELRPDVFTAMQDGVASIATRGDLVMASYDVLDEVMAAARVTAVSGGRVEVDAEVTVPEGYAVRFQSFGDDPEDGSSVTHVVPITSSQTATRHLFLTNTAVLPTLGHVVHVGPMSQDSLALRIKDRETAEDFQSRLTMVAAAPEIGQLTDQDIPPAWDGRVGVENAASAVLPATPLISRIESGFQGTGSRDRLNVLVAPGPGSSRAISGYALDHRLAGTTPWTTVEASAAAASFTVEDYVAGDEVELLVRALAGLDASPNSEIVSHVIASEDQALPEALASDAFSVTGGFGHALLQLALPSSNAGQAAAIYRAPAGDVFDPALHLLRDAVPVAPGATTTTIDGDATRSQVLTESWTLGSGWSGSAGSYAHDGVAASDLVQSIALEAGTSYRFGFVVSGRTAGSLTAGFSGGSGSAVGPVSVNGPARFSLAASSGDTVFELQASADFDGTVSELFLFAESASSAPQGEFDYYIELKNSDGQSGPVAGPKTAEIL
ncbi:MAG: phage tail protein [Pseudomonadota bacterium]